MLGSFFLSISISQGGAGVHPLNNSPWLDTLASAVVKLWPFSSVGIAANAQSHTVERTQAVLGPATLKSHLARSIFHDPSAQEGTEEPPCKVSFSWPFSSGRAKQCWSSQVIPGFQQPRILDFCALVLTLVKGWVAPLRDFNYFSLYPASLELLPNPHRLLKELLLYLLWLYLVL